LIAVGSALIAVILSGRTLIGAMIVVTAEGVLMAVIMIVEDDVFIREIAKLMIEDWGHNTLSVGNGIACRVEHTQFRPKLDRNDSPVC